MKIDFSKPLETVLGEPVKYICSDVVEYKNARICVDDEGIACSSPYIGIQIRNVKEEWNGEGLPPIGTVCEWHPSVHGWIEVTILGRDGEDTWYRVKGESHTDTCRNMSFFRPIRTPEQIAAKVRSKACDEIYGVLTGPTVERKGNTSDMAEALYDAGYRKQVAP